MTPDVAEVHGGFLELLHEVAYFPICFSSTESIIFLIPAIILFDVDPFPGHYRSCTCKKSFSLMCCTGLNFWFVDDVVGPLVRRVDDRWHYVSISHKIGTC